MCNGASINKSCTQKDSEQIKYKKLYKYYSLEGGISALLNQTLLFNYPFLFNDLFECRFSSEKSGFINSSRQHVVVPYNLSDSFLILCLSQAPHIFRLWTFYAEAFDGIVVEYDVPINTSEYLIFDINYYDESQYDSVFENYRNYFSDLRAQHNKDDAINLIKLIAGNKHNVWEYEQETRLVKFVDKNIFNCANNHHIVSQDSHKNIKESLRLFNCSDLGIRISKIYIGRRFFEKYQCEYDFLFASDETQFIDYYSNKYKHFRFLRFLLKKYGNENIYISNPIQKNSSVESCPLHIKLEKLPDCLVNRFF